MARGKQIFVPQMGTIYPSAAAAASALGIDASNIGKVIRGKRLSAGGYSFVEVDPMASQETLKWIAEAEAGRLTPKQRQRQAKQRQKGFKRLSPEEQAAAKARARAAKELSRSLKEANKLLKQYQKEGLSGISSVVPELENMKAIIGKNKRGGFQADPKLLIEGFSQEQLEALKKQIDTQMNRKDFKDIEKAKQRKMGIANQLGISMEELENYEALLPTLWHVLKLSHQIEGASSDPVYQEILDALEAGVDPEELKEILQEIEAEHQDIVNQMENKEQDEILDELANNPTYQETLEPYFTRIRELEEQAEAQRREEEEEEDGADWLEGWTPIN